MMDFQEFVNLMLTKDQNGMELCEAKEAFRIFDRDDRGFILTSELRQAFATLEEDIPESELDEILEDKCQSGNRKISFEGKDFFYMLWCDLFSVAMPFVRVIFCLWTVFCKFLWKVDVGLK